MEVGKGPFDGLSRPDQGLGSSSDNESSSETEISDVLKNHLSFASQEERVRFSSIAEGRTISEQLPSGFQKDRLLRDLVEACLLKNKLVEAEDFVDAISSKDQKGYALRLVIRHEAQAAIQEFLGSRSTVKSRTKLAETMSLLINKAWSIPSASEKSEAIVDIAKLLIVCDWQLARDLTKEYVKETVRDVVFEAAVSHYTKPQFFCTKEGTIAAFEAASLIQDAVIQESARELLFHALLNQTHLPAREALKFIHAIISNARSVEQKETFCEQLFRSKVQTNNYQLALDAIALMKTSDRRLSLYKELISLLLLTKSEPILQTVAAEVQQQFGNKPLYSIVDGIVEKKCSEKLERNEKRAQARMLLKMIDDSNKNKNAMITEYVKSLVSQADLTSAYYLAGEMPTIKEQSECRFTLFHLAIRENNLPLADMIAKHIPDQGIRKRALQLLRELTNS